MNTTQLSFPIITSTPEKVKVLSETAPILDRIAIGLLLAAFAAALLKGYCAWTTIGSQDVSTFAIFATRLSKIGLTAFYHETIVFNHTPLIAAYIQLIREWSLKDSHLFPFLLRLPGIMADLALAGILIFNRRRQWAAGCPTWALALLILSPVSFMVSGYHGNFDPVMVFLLFAAAVLAVEERPATSGLLFALSLQIKVAPMIVLPVFLVYFARRRGALARFIAAAGVVCLAGYGVALAKDPVVFLKNVFGYNGYWGIWGITYWLWMSGWEPFAKMAMTGHGALTTAIIQVLKAGILLSGAILAWRQGTKFPANRLFSTLGLAWGIFFVFSPSVAPQYLVWLAPFIMLRDARWFLALTTGSTLGAFFFYQRISGGLPWNYGSSDPAMVPLWTPWMLWAWAGCIYGLLPGFGNNRPSETLCRP